MKERNSPPNFEGLSRESSTSDLSAENDEEATFEVVKVYGRSEFQQNKIINFSIFNFQFLILKKSKIVFYVNMKLLKNF